MNIDYIIDKINIKTIPEIISGYMRDNNCKKYNNSRSFYKELLSQINNNLVDSYLNRILKYLSSDEESVINIFEDINDGVYDESLKEFCIHLCNEIDRFSENKKLYEKINSSINRIYFEYKEFIETKFAHNNEEYPVFMFNILKHAFHRYKINLPNITAKRVYNEALVLDDNSEERRRLIELSSELGDQDAILLHASYIFDEDPNKAVELYLKCKSSPSALWKIAYSIENGIITPETVLKVKKVLKDILSDKKNYEDITISNSQHNKNMNLAVKIYMYCANKYTFNKALNRLGRLLINEKIKYKNSKNKSKKLAIEYLTRAIRLGNIDSVTTMAIYYNNNRDNSDYDQYLERKYFEISAKYGNTLGCRYYGEILVEEGLIDDSIKYFKKAAQNNEPVACYHLGKYYEMNNDYASAIRYYKKSISLKRYSTVLDLAYLYDYLANIENNKTYNNMAKSLIKYYYKFLDDEIKIECKQFLE